MSYSHKSLLLFIIAIGLISGVFHQAPPSFGDINYWNERGVFFLLFITLFPRLTLLFSSVASGGFFWWLAWLFAPRFLVALLATISYWNTNPILVTISWFIALGGEASEKSIVLKKKRGFKFKNTVVVNNESYDFDSRYNVYDQYEDPSSTHQNDAIEASFKRKEVSKD